MTRHGMTSHIPRYVLVPDMRAPCHQPQRLSCRILWTPFGLPGTHYVSSCQAAQPDQGVCLGAWGEAGSGPLSAAGEHWTSCCPLGTHTTEFRRLVVPGSRCCTCTLARQPSSCTLPRLAKDHQYAIAWTAAGLAEVEEAGVQAASTNGLWSTPIVGVGW